MSITSKLAGITVVFFLSIFLVACGGGTNNTASQAGTGTVAILLTDLPSDDFSEINLTITKIELIADYDSRVTVFSGEKTQDLLKLETHSDLFSLADNVPVGFYHKIRLTLTDIELVKKDDSGQIIETFHPKLPGNGKLDLKPKVPFFVSTDEALMVQIDVDAKNSLHIVQNGNDDYLFRPVVFIDILSGDLPGKFLQLHGLINDINTDEKSFMLCNSSYAYHNYTSDDDRRDYDYDSENDDDYDDDNDDYRNNNHYPIPCIKVQGDAETSLFSHIPEHTPEWTDLNNNDPVTVTGHLKHSADNDHEFFIDAVAIEIGPQGSFTQIAGVIKSTVDNSTMQFGFEIAPGQGFIGGTMLTIQLQGGTQILSKEGIKLGSGDITPEMEARISGLLVLSDDQDDVLNASIIFLDTSVSMTNKLSGVMSDIDTDSGGLTLMTMDLGDRCISTNDHTDIFLITVDNGSYSSDHVTLNELTDGHHADVYGHFGITGCFSADNIIADAMPPG